MQILRRQVHYLLEQIASGARTYSNVEFAGISREEDTIHPPATEPGEPGKVPQLPLIHARKEGTIHASGCHTDRPANARTASRRQSIFTRDDQRRRGAQTRRRDPAPGDRDAEAELHAAALERQALSERLWGLEECLDAKEEELSLQRAELEHLRFLIGVKEARPLPFPLPSSYRRPIRPGTFLFPTRPSPCTARSGLY